jgi:hypothetical protein
MNSAFVVIKDDEEIEVDDTPANREGARKKGYEIHELLRSPKGEEVAVPERLAEAAIKKGYQFSDTYVPPGKRKTEYGGIESGVKGYLDSASFGLDDEITARAKSLMGGADYDTELKAERAQKKWSEEDNPEEYFGGQIAGGVAGSVLAPGGGVAKGAGLAARTAKNAITGAALGGLSAYGQSEQEDLGDQLADVGEGALTGAALGGTIPLAAGLTAKTGSGIVRKIPGIEKPLEGFYKAVGEVPDHIAEMIKKKPELVARAKAYPGNAAVADSIAETANLLRKEQKILSDEAWEELIKLDRQKPGAVRGTVLANKAIGVARSNNLMGAKQAAQIKAATDLKRAMEDVAKANSYAELKTAIMKIDDNINWDVQKAKLSNKVLQQFRTEMDQVLKQNREYAIAMEPLEAKTKAIAELQNKFGLKKGSTTVNGNLEPSFYPTDRTVTQLETQAGQSLALNDKGTYTQKMLKTQAPEVNQNIKARGMEKFMTADIGRGSRSSVAVGGLLGAVMSAFGLGPVPPMAGAILGYARDKMGREFAVSGLARIGMASAKAGTRVGGKEAGILEKAAQKGTQAYIVTHKMLMEKSPEYARAFEEEMQSE